jgi:thiamine kinase-like enzyme
MVFFINNNFFSTLTIGNTMINGFGSGSNFTGEHLGFILAAEEGIGRVSDADEQRLIEEHLSKTASLSSGTESSTELSVVNTQNKQVKELIAKYVKSEQVDPIMDAFKKLFNDKINELSLVTNGRGTSKIFKFSSEDNEYILRVTDSTRPAFFIDTDSEILNMQLVNDLEVAPKLHLADPRTGTIIMECVRNVPLTVEMVTNKEQSETLYSALAKSLANLHKGPDFPSKPINIFRDIEVRSKEAEASRIPQIAHKVLSSIMNVEKVMEKHQTTAPCHRDLHSNNVLYNGKRIYLIDWELGTNSDPISDLGFASMFFVFDPAKEEFFLEKYFGKAPTPEQKAYFFLMKQVCICCYACRLMRRVTGLGKMDLSKESVELDKLQNYRDFILENYNGCSKSFNNDDLKTFIYVFLKEALQNIESERFNKSIEVLSS